MPNYSSDLFFSLQTTILTLIGPLFTILRRAPEAKSAQGKLYSKGSPLTFFYFFKETYKTGRAQRVPPLSFLIFCNGMFVNKSRRVPPFTFFGTMRLLLKEKFFQKFQFFSKKSVLRFLSLRYGAHFRRSRLVFLQTTILTLIGPLFTILSRAPEAKSAQGKLYSKGSPLSFFTFSRKHTKPDVPKGSPPLDFFRHCATFFRKFFNVPKGSPFHFLLF